MIDLTAVQSWLTAGNAPDAATFAEGFAAQLVAAGVPIARFRISFATRHPEVMQFGAAWEPGQPVAVRGFSYSAFANALRTGGTSPIADVIYGNVPEVRRRIEAASLAEFPVLEEMRAAGMTDCLCLPLLGTDGRRTFFSVATGVPGGFTEDQLDAVRRIGPLLALRSELIAAHDSTGRLLEVYLGTNASRRVLAGAFRRGEGELLRAALFTCDMRGFTHLVDQTPVAEVVRLLDAHFERIAQPLAAAGGEILKFVGDAILAIFPLGDDAPGACQRALKASAADGRLKIGVGLHLGDVMYGNVGAAQRLDFTAIGAAVNEVCRVEALGKELGKPLLATSAFVAAHGAEGLHSVGEHTLRGVSRATELFTLPRYAASSREQSRDG